MQMTQSAIDYRNSEIANGNIKEEWMKDEGVRSFLNALCELTAKR